MRVARRPLRVTLTTMSNRHLSRSIAMQTLFEWDFNSENETDSGLEEEVQRNIREFAPGLEDRNFSLDLVRGVLANRRKLDSIIEKSAPEWPLTQIAIIDRNVLRLGLYELLFGNKKEVPPRVAINEAIELAKTFGGETSGKFVNGVLGTVYKELGEPDKESESELEHKIQKEIPLEKLGGAVVYKKEEDGTVCFAMVHDVFGYWTLSKGHLEEEEDLKNGTAREMKEELGVDVEFEGELGSNEYVANHPEKGQIRKSVTYFLAKTKDKDLKLGASGGLNDARWFKEEELDGLKIYEDIKPLINAAIEKLKKQ